MKAKLLLFILVLGVVFISCETEDPTEDPKETITLLDTYRAVSENYTVNKTYVYNADNQLITINSNDGDSDTEYDLEYDSEGRLIKFYINDNLDQMFSYSSGKVTKSSYYNGEFSSKKVYEVNANNKITREQLEGSDYYSTYTWDGDNMQSLILHNPDGVTKTTTTYTYNMSIMAPAHNRYGDTRLFTYTHPMLSSKNVYSSKLWDYNDEITEYNLTANDEGYLSKRIKPLNSGVQTQTFTYKSVEIE